MHPGPGLAADHNAAANAGAQGHEHAAVCPLADPCHRLGVARQGGVGRLVLTHIQPWTDPGVPLAEARVEFDGDIEVAMAGSTWVL